MEAEFSRLNTSDLKAENEVRSFHEKRPGYERREKTYRIPSKDGVRIVRKGLKKYKDSMQNWVEHTFVHKPKSVVFEEKSKLENATSKGSANASIPLDRLKAFWGFERDFDNLMRKYEKDMTNRVFHHYDRVFDNFLGHRGDFLDVPKSLADIERTGWSTQNTNSIEWESIADTLADFLDEQMDVVFEDNSPDEVAVQIVDLYKLFVVPSHAELLTAVNSMKCLPLPYHGQTS
ncbi:uncharacterized protein LOC103509680 [Diaphorina citri]|uniref:Uncharacterized protein LOC103509680 n=1 Tax=Diaphorina citri TaxID=121845 RepID=A0A3Q0IYK0_DIACI|nr:uncharacterized protein LOC103509680 [Diaphorina citri]